MDKTPEEVEKIFEKLGSNSQQKSSRGRKVSIHGRVVEEEKRDRLDELLAEMREIKKMQVKEKTKEQTCGICEKYGHGANICPNEVNEVQALESSVDEAN